jgi:uncharacterized protein (TIGR03437 family)
VALDGNGGLYAGGVTADRGFVTTPGAWQPLFPTPKYWTGDGFVAKFNLNARASTQISNIVNAASMAPGGWYIYLNGAVSAGEIVTIFGSDFPANPTVTFDGVPAPILYSGKNQINAVVPFGVRPPGTTVLMDGARGYVLPVWAATPGLFTADGSGKGQLAALNPDASVNSAANPARAGSVISAYLTGAGPLAPALGDGQSGPLQPPFPSPPIGASATINGKQAPVAFIGQAPGLIAGLIQVNVQIPEGTPAGNVTLVVYIGLDFTQPGSIAVQ